ncbi:MAG TPA: P-loop NTPase, partial [Phycisphaeraceae bacterium]
MTAHPSSPFPPLMPPSGMAPQAGGSRFKPIDPLRVLREHVRALIVLAVVGVVVGVAVWGLLRLTMPRYTSMAQLRVSSTINEVWKGITSEVDQRTNMERLEAFMQDEAMRIQSEEILNSVLDRPEVRSTHWFASYVDPKSPDALPNLRNAREDLAKDHLRVFPIRGTTLIHVSVSTPNEEDPDKILAAIIDVYLQRLRLSVSDENMATQVTFRQELDRTERAIQDLEKRMQEFLSREGLESLKSESSAAAIEYQNYATQQAQLAMALDQAQQAYDAMVEARQSGQYQPSPQDLLEIEAVPTVRAQTDRLRQLVERRDALLAVLAPNHMEIKRLEAQIAATEADRQREIDRLVRESQAADLENAAKAVEAIKAQLAALEPKLAEASRRMTDLTSRLTQYEQMEDMLMRAKEERQRAADALASVRVYSTHPSSVPVQRYASPTEPELSFPLPEVTIPAVALLILAGGTGVIFLREMLDQRVKSPSDARMFTDVQLLGVLPDVVEDPNGPARMERVVEKDPTGLMAEAFRQLRTGLLTQMDRRGYKTLAVTAAQPGSGASSVAQNLAVSLAHNGRKVLLIDANLRRPSQHRLFELGEGPGLAEVLRGQATLEEAMRQPSQGLDVWVLSAGGAHDALPELLEGQRLRSVLSQAETR